MARTTITGLGQLNAKLRRMPGLVDEAARGAVRDEVKDTAGDMRDAAPVDTGELVEGIREQINPGGLSGAAASTAAHSSFVNDGTRKQDAQPFATQAAVRMRGRFPKRMAVALSGAVRKTARG
jgi:HK97 gp10 family phage protein